MIIKFETKESINTKGEAIRFAQQCEQISDDFAVKFVEWVSKDGWYFDYKEQKKHNLTELLQIFKTNFYE